MKNPWTKEKSFVNSVARLSGFTPIWVQNPLWEFWGYLLELAVSVGGDSGGFLYEIGGEMFVSFLATLFPEKIDDFEIHQELAN